MKYDKLKQLLVPQAVINSTLSYDHGSSYLTFERCGEYDGSYVLPAQIGGNYPLEVLSYGIGSDEHGCSFEQSLNTSQNKIYMYDGSIEEVPVPIMNGVFHPEHVDSCNFEHHLEECEMSPKNMNILKMDIEGNEYEWGTPKNFSLAAKYFSVFCIEVHSLIDFIPAGWVIEPQLLAAKRDPVMVQEFFERMNEDFILWHMHGNNHSPCSEGLPDCLELTYINKRVGSAASSRRDPFPVDELDKPNYNAKPDYVLDWWL